MMTPHLALHRQTKYLYTKPGFVTCIPSAPNACTAIESFTFTKTSKHIYKRPRELKCGIIYTIMNQQLLTASKQPKRIDHEVCCLSLALSAPGSPYVIHHQSLASTRRDIRDQQMIEGYQHIEITQDGRPLPCLSMESHDTFHPNPKRTTTFKFPYLPPLYSSPHSTPHSFLRPPSLDLFPTDLPSDE